jgi:hypothetical protein
VLLAREAGSKAFARVATWSGVLVIASTVYLGFHWVLDVVFGVIAGVVCYGLARRVVETSLARSLLPVAPDEPDALRSPISNATEGRGDITGT